MTCFARSLSSWARLFSACISAWRSRMRLCSALTLVMTLALTAASARSLCRKDDICQLQLWD